MNSNFYETDRALAEYLLFHYGGRQEILPHPSGPADALFFPVRCVSEMLEPGRLPAGARALDLGCAVGRSSLELARYCAEVVGIDFSETFVAAARQLMEAGMMDAESVEEGLLTRRWTARVPEEIDRGRVRFEQGDAQALREDLGDFDVVLLANLLDRLREPARCLARLASLVRPGGQLIITSPYTWLEEYTPRANWLGGFVREGRPVRTLDTLRERLGPDFQLARARDLPLLIREHARKYQWSVAEASLWLRSG